MQHLFVYGSLAKGKTNEHLLNNIGGTWKQASLKGNLLQKGWGAVMGFPGLILNEKGKEIHGYVFSSENLKEYWAELDAFEGAEYVRVLANVKLGNSSQLQAHVYVLRSSEQG